MPKIVYDGCETNGVELEIGIPATDYPGEVMFKTINGRFSIPLGAARAAAAFLLKVADIEEAADKRPGLMMGDS